MRKPSDILASVATVVGPMGMILLKNLIDESKESDFIRHDESTTILFKINHKKVMKKLSLESKAYWLLMERLVEDELVFKRLIKLQGELKSNLYIRFNFEKLAAYGGSEEDNANSKEATN